MTPSPARIARLTPTLAALAAALVGAINVASALTPTIRWRGHLLLDFEPVEAVRLLHAFALPTGMALLLVAPYLFKRRRRAWQAAIALMLALGLLDLFKGLDFEETAITWLTAAWLARGRSAFGVDHDAITVRSAVWRVPLLGARSGSGGRGSLGVAGPSVADLSGARDLGPAALAARPAAPARHAAGGDRARHRGRHAAGDRLCDLPPAGRPARASGQRRSQRCRRAGARPRRRHAVVLQAARRQALLLQRRPLGVRRLPGGERRAAAVR